ncbi:MAG: 5-formyltetrahydrofolate cyclo-ligase [Calothrix sp. C42_A2020_038]|nr:5-formyltetrahydrofolate cyclo-ligase [Calothrix sp. C42_A2020_038]
MCDKIQLRRELLQARAALPPIQWRLHSDSICANLTSSNLLVNTRTILAYFSFRQEPDLSPLFSDPHYSWGFPRCVGKNMSWHIWTPGDPLNTNAYGTKEPSSNAPTIEPSEVDLILVPCVACDYQGYRLGYGGGYYDRMFSIAEWQAIPTVGIVFEFAYLPKIPIESWDQPLQYICTEKNFHECLEYT